MTRRLLTGALAGLAASLSLATAVRAGVVTFDDRVFTPDPIGGLYGAQETANGFTEQGLRFYTNEGFVIPTQLSCDPGAPGCDAVFPTTFTSNFWETFGEDVVITAADGGLFDFQSLRLGLGVGYPGEPETDIVHMSWIKNGDTFGQDLTLGLGFGLNTFSDLTGVSSVTIGPTRVLRYLVFDDVTFGANGGAIPEPAAWTMMIAGFAGVGAMIRRGRRGLARADAA
jgi:hypothetical protein